MRRTPGGGFKCAAHEQLSATLHSSRSRLKHQKMGINHRPREKAQETVGIKHELRRLLWRVGYDIWRFEPLFHPVARRKRVFESYAIDTVLDVGASSGSFGQELRHDIGYGNRILSFEPQSEAFELSKANAKDDPAWEVFNCAIGDTEGSREINISRNSDSSSLLNMLPSHLKSAPHSEYIGRAQTEMRTLDSVVGDLCGTAKNIYLKVDTQGFEGAVLRGAELSLPLVDTVQLEMSLVSLYEGGPLFDEMYTVLNQKGYSLVAIDGAFSDPGSGQLLQVDGTFHRFRPDT